MLFNSVAFIFWFLPIVILGFFSIGKFSHRAAGSWLIAAAITFYGYWNVKYIGLLCGSILFNYIFGYFISRLAENEKQKLSKLMLSVAIASNLGLLAYYKYYNFFLSQIDAAVGTNYHFENTILPLGISFFTFTQIAFLVDAYKLKAKEYDLLRYFLFVTYFPHLIAGPIIHHAEMMPQFLAKTTYTFSKNNFIIGTLIFCVGLAKKILLADNIAPYADAIFNANHAVTFFESWGGALAYTFQLYFDFSGYCDMAIGLSKMINILLPVNFNSPYKSQNIIDFWRCWHITLSRFLRDYLYIPLGGNRKGNFNRYRNLLATMILGGLWHGASWTFVLWGALHGTYLVINHQWRELIKHRNYTAYTNNLYYKITAWALTFSAVVFAWVLFRAETFQTAKYILSGMFGLTGFAKLETIPAYTKILFSSALFVCFLLPNTQQIFARYKPGLETYPGDIKAGYLMSYFNWATFIKYRYFSYLWISYLISISLMIVFYTTNVEAKIWERFPAKHRPDYVDMVVGDYRSNLFSNDIFFGKKRKVVIVGSSYTQIMGKFNFKINDEKYKSASVGNAGNSLTNGFRTAATILENFKVDTIIFGVSPLGFGHFNTDTKTASTLDEQCRDSLNKVGITKKILPFQSCQPMHLSINEVAQIALEPGDNKFFQFQNFLHKMREVIFFPAMPIETVDEFSHNTIKSLDAMKSQIQFLHNKDPLTPSLPDNGNNKDFHWLHRDILESLNQDGEVFTAFQALKKLADSKGVRLVVYNTPTVSSRDASHIYPKGFIESYRKKLFTVMNKLEIQYYDFGDDKFIWDRRYTFDFIHLTFDARKRIHAKLISNIFHKDNLV